MLALGQQGAEPDLRIYAVVPRCERIQAILQLRPWGSLRSRQFQPPGAALGQQGTEAEPGRLGVLRLLDIGVSLTPADVQEL